MQHSVTLDLYEYWIALKGQRYSPERYEVEPNGIRSILSNTFILETDPLEGTRFRLAGTNICSLFGRDLKQNDFLEFWSDHARETLESSLRILRDNQACIYISWTGRTARYHETKGELLLLPLVHDGKTRRVLGSFTAYETPYWQGTFPVVKMELSDIRVILPTEHGLSLFSDDKPPEQNPDIFDTGADIGYSDDKSSELDVFANNLEGRRVRHLTILNGGQNKI